MRVHALRRVLRRLAGAAGAVGLVATAVVGLSVAGAAPALAGCTSEAVTVLTVQKLDPDGGAPLSGAQFSAAATSSGTRVAALSGAALTAWNGVVSAGLAATDPSSSALVSARTASSGVTPVSAMSSRTTVTTDSSGIATLLVYQLCGYSPSAATVTLTETVAPAGHILLDEPIVVRALRPQVTVLDTIGVVAGPADVTMSQVAAKLISAASAPSETSAYGRGTVTVPNSRIVVLPTSEIVVLPTSSALPDDDIAYTGINVAGMSGLAALLLGGGALALLAGRALRRKPRRH